MGTVNERKRDAGGRFANEHLCDGCNRPAPMHDYCTDEEVCGVGDGPGFVICRRKRCAAKLHKLTVAERAALYAANRAARKASGAAGGK
jgi:hypothetical protein